MRAKNEHIDKPDPQWVKTTLAEDMADMHERSGVLPSSREIDETVSEELRGWQRRQAERKPQQPQNATGRAVPADVQLPAGHTPADAARATEALSSFRERFDPARHVRHKMRCQCGGSICRACRLRNRLVALVARGESGAASKAFLFPVAAAAILDAFASQRFKRRAYRGLSPADAERKLLADLENIADAASATLGEWRP